MVVTPINAMAFGQKPPIPERFFAARLSLRPVGGCDRKLAAAAMFLGWAAAVPVAGFSPDRATFSGLGAVVFSALAALSLRSDTVVLVAGTEGAECATSTEAGGFLLATVGIVPNDAAGAEAFAGEVEAIGGGPSVEVTDFVANRIFCSSSVWLMRTMASTSARGIFWPALPLFPPLVATAV
jgi:hypothetical protein